MRRGQLPYVTHNAIAAPHRDLQPAAACYPGVHCWRSHPSRNARPFRRCYPPSPCRAVPTTHVVLSRARLSAHQTRGPSNSCYPKIACLRSAIGHLSFVTHQPDADGAPFNRWRENMNTRDIVDGINTHHRARRYWMKVQQKLDRALESYVRLNHTDWTKTENEADRKKESAKALAIIKAAKGGDGPSDLVLLVGTTLTAREPADQERKSRERTMEELAEQLPVYPWVEGV